MKTTLKTAAALAGSIGLLAGAASAQTSPVVGFYSVDLAVGFNIMGVSLHANPLISGTFEGDLNDTDVDFSTVLTAPVLAANTILVEVEAGGGEEGAVAVVTGYSTTTNPNDTLTLEGGATLATGTAAYTLRPAPTLNDVFGASLTGANFSTAGADIVWLPDGSGGYDQYAYKIPEGEFRSTSGLFASPPKPIPVFYPDGMFVQVQGPATTVVVSGDLKTGGTILPANEGFNLVASPGPVGVTLGVSDMQSFLAGANFSTAGADIVWLPDGTGDYDQYVYKTSDSVWRLTTSLFGGDENDTELTTGFFIQRQAAGDTSGIAKVPTYYDGL